MKFVRFIFNYKKKVIKDFIRNDRMTPCLLSDPGELRLLVNKQKHSELFYFFDGEIVGYVITVTV